MLKTYVPAHEEIIVEKTLEYLHEDGCGYSFELGNEGTPIFSCQAARDNYELCEATREKFSWIGKKVRRRRVKISAVGICQCGAEVPLAGGYYGATECNCGRWYNVMGQEILPPKMWEEDLEEWD